MDAADLATLSRLLDQALDRDPADRLPWVDALGPEYERLKPRLRHLLAEPLSFETDSLDTLPRFDVPADTTGPGAAPDRAGADRAGEGRPAPRWSADTARPEPGALVGPYRLVRLLAEGGMGSVWLGERADGLVKRPVAIKLPQGAWRRAGLAERMARERDILASLTHPHIARLYDAGLTADGQPFLALEHVDGRPIDEYCRAASLDVRARVALFLQVARAVAYAHGRLVVHRDLKPSNILVTADGQVRLLDFGVAKMLDEQMAESTVTAIAGAAFTPAYASPEQMDGSATGVGSDVYSLGVVLFELLTGRRPHQPEERSFRTLAAALASDAPVPLASGLAGDVSARRALRGDLDTILSKALKKSVTERYATVDALAEDLSRYLEGRPVLARPDSTSYILAKIVRRHALAVAAAAAVLVAIVAGAGVALWQMQVARAEQQRAEAVKEFVASIFREANPYQAPGTVPTAPALLRQARERIDQQFAGRPALRVELLNIVSSSLMQLMDVDSAEPIALDAVTSARRQLGERDLHTLRSRVLWMQVNRHRGRTREMRAEIDALAQDLRSTPGVPAADLVVVTKQRAHMEIDDGRYADAEVTALEADRLAVARLGEDHPEAVGTGLVLTLSYIYGKKTEAAMQAAERTYRRALDAAGGNRAHPQVIEAQSVYGRALGEAGDLAGAIRHIGEARDQAAELFGPTAMMVGYFSQNLVGHQIDVGDLEGARANSERAVAILSTVAAPASYSVAAALRARGLALLRSGLTHDAVTALEEAVAGLTQSVGETHEATLTAGLELALARAASGRRTDLAASRDAIAALAAAVERLPSPSALLRARTFHALGSVDRAMGRFDAALGAQRAAIAALGEGPAADRMRMRALGEVGANQLALGRWEEASATLADALARYERLEPHETPERRALAAALRRARGQARGEAASGS